MVIIDGILAGRSACFGRDVGIAGMEARMERD